MSRIVPKLNLNKTPQLVENNSLVMAKNIRLLEDGTIGPDTSLEEIEKNVGNGTPYVVHHDAIIETKTNYQYTTLNLDTTIEYIKNDIEPDDIDLEDDAFDFYNYHPNLEESQPITNSDNINRTIDTNTLKFVKVDDNNECIIYCYRYDNEYVYWTCERFSYNRNENELINNNGFRLYLAVYEDYYNDGIEPPTGTVDTFYYILLPKVCLGTNIIIQNYTFIVINPVYFTQETETVVIQEAYDETKIHYDTIKYIGQIVGLDNKIYFFKENNWILDSSEARAKIAKLYPNEVFVGSVITNNQTETFDVNDEGYITRRGIIFDNATISIILTPLFINRVKIFEYDEVAETFTMIKCAWKYSGGEINGCVTVNSTGEPILTICEYNVPSGALIPIKHINLSKCKLTDDESFYTQAPNIPITNLLLDDLYIKNIPSGVYQFFIRYKIHDNFYTTWFPCSKELFAGSKKQTNTLQGSIKHIDLHEDSNFSFIFEVNHLFPNYCSKFEQFQIGFIISSEGGVFARSWKHFDIITSKIYFEYNQEDIEEINIDDLLKVNFDIFNVENIAPYKNKLYISNYKETDFNENLATYAKQIKIKFKLQDVSFDGSDYYFNDIPLHESSIAGIYDSFGATEIKYTFGQNNYCNVEDNEESSTQVEDRYPLFDEGYPQGSGGQLPEGYLDDIYISHISKIYTTYNNTNYYLLGSASSEGNQTINNTYDNHTIIENVIDGFRELIIGVNTNGEYIAVINGTQIVISNIIVECKTYSFDWDENMNGSDQHGTIQYGCGGYVVHGTTHRLTRIISLKNLISANYSTGIHKEYNTLLPFTKYDFYVHYVKQNGIATNGYFIGTKEVKRYCKGYQQTNRHRSPYKVLDSIDDLDDLCFYNPTDEEYAYYYDSNLGTTTYYYMVEEDLTEKNIIYPTFDNIICPPGYVGCFISISKYNTNVAQAFNHHTDIKQEKHIFDCLELDCVLYNILNNITVVDNKGIEITKTAIYYSSSTTNPVEYLGCSGHVEFNQQYTVDSKFWIVIDSVNKPYNKTLIKLTPFIKLANSAVSYDNYEQVNSPGYYCEVKKLNMEYCDAVDAQNQVNSEGYYVSGNDIYIRDITNEGVSLTEVTDRVDYHTSENFSILSNFNLNYLSLTNDLTPIVRRFDIETEDDYEGGTIVNSKKQLITLVDSLICSFILELKSMYRDYTRKLYYEYTKNNIVKFDNTLRVSSIDVDEIYRYIYRFEATDYYNVPTQRGIITNLVAIANTLYVHCEHSLFKFSDNKTINAQEEEVTLQENDIFNSGISEVFDAQYGYAGLKSRKQSLITYNAYVFYDAVTKTIYAFGGEQQIGSISNSIKKLIDKINPTDVRFVGDELHDRFFVNLINNEGNVCLSFNFNAKSFISVHDIEFNFGFHSRRHSYFIHENFYNGNSMGWSIYRITDYILTIVNRTNQNQDVININGINYVKNYVAYQNCYKQSLIQIIDCDRNIILNEVKAANSCVDIIVNTEYEVIKVLNYMNWICSEIRDYGKQANECSEEILNRRYSGTKLRIYSDATKTSLFDLVRPDGNQKISNEQRNIDANGNISPNLRNWQYPQYNCGVWSMNYFRDIQNTDDIFDYMDAENGLIGEVGYSGTSETTDLRPFITRQNLTQENSLLYGKYFVVRFIFNNKNFKLENIKLNMGDYGKTK